ncbi:hypothetical protein GCM10007985_04000 [Aliarcobacter butzleri]|nr:hypothetical protein GCM10007985_04000 [Aliarcobacter butzleri]
MKVSPQFPDLINGTILGSSLLIIFFTIANEPFVDKSDIVVKSINLGEYIILLYKLIYSFL